MAITCSRNDLTVPVRDKMSWHGRYGALRRYLDHVDLNVGWAYNGWGFHLTILLAYWMLPYLKKFVILVADLT